MPREMTHEEARAFLLAGTRTGKLATARADGRPHVTPIWFTLDEDEIVFTTHGTSIKAKSIQSDPRVCFCVDDQVPPYSYVMLEGTATLSEDVDDLVRWATVIGGRYMGADRAEEFGARNGVPGELLVRIAPSRAVTRAAMTD